MLLVCGKAGTKLFFFLHLKNFSCLFDLLPIFIIGNGNQNHMKHISIFILTTFLSIAQANAQALVNNLGANVYINPGAFVIIRTNSLHNFTGYVQNGGEFVIEGDVINDAQLAGGTSATGLYRVLGDWVNNGSVNSMQDTVHLYGHNQLIGGTVPTAFNNLLLTGQPSSIKVMGNDAYVDGWLNLTDVELATNQYNMTVRNTNLGAILNTMIGSEEDFGFVSSLDTGKLIRHTNNTSAYYYPLGTPTSTGVPFYYRPLDVSPSSAALNAYGARLTKDPSYEGYDVDIMDDILCKVNPLYYHNISHQSGSSPADLKFYFNAANDRPWTDVGHWKNSQWNYTTTASAGLGGGYNTLEINNWNDFDPEPFALAAKKFTIEAGPDHVIFAGENVTLNPTYTATNIASHYWSPDRFLDNANNWDVNSRPNEDITYQLYAINDLGCEALDTLHIRIKPAELLIPTAFSPNGDGVNDVYRVVKENVSEFLFQIFNRWGEKVFETTDVEEGWDGVYKDVPQPMDVFTWQVWFKLSGSNQKKFKSGNVTLVR